MTIGDSYFQHPYLNQWNKLYPGQDFPTPERYPYMYPAGTQTKVQTDTIDPLFPNCSARKCPRGLIDYRCQYENGCYLKLAELGFDLLATFIVVSLAIALIGKLCALAYHFFTGIFFVTKIVSCMTRLLQCLSFGMFAGDVVVEVQVQTGRKMTREQEKIERKLGEIGMEINFEALDQFQIKKVADILEDYEIVSEKKSEIEEKF